MNSSKSVVHYQKSVFDSQSQLLILQSVTIVIRLSLGKLLVNLLQVSGQTD